MWVVRLGLANRETKKTNRIRQGKHESGKGRQVGHGKDVFLFFVFSLCCRTVNICLTVWAMRRCSFVVRVRVRERQLPDWSSLLIHALVIHALTTQWCRPTIYLLYLSTPQLTKPLCASGSQTTHIDTSSTGIEPRSLVFCHKETL